MYIEYFKRVQTQLPFSALDTKVRCAPTTFVNRGAKVNLSSYQILTPAGVVAGDIEDEFEKWGTIGVQQIPDVPVLEFTRDRGTKWVGNSADPEVGNSADAEKLEHFEKVISYLQTRLEEYFCDPLEIVGFIYKDVVFLTQVAPPFFRPDWKGHGGKVLMSYQVLVERGCMKIEDVLLRLRRYSSFFHSELCSIIPGRMLQYAGDWLRNETGGASWVGSTDVIDGRDGVRKSPVEGRLYQVSSFSDIPTYDELVDHQAIVLTSEVVTTGVLDTVFREVSDRAEKAGYFQKLIVYLEGVSTQEEFSFISKRLKTKIPLGVAVSRWGQLLRLLKGTVHSAHGFLVNIDSLYDDGVIYHLHERLKLPSPNLVAEYDLRQMGRTSDISVLWTERLSVPEMISVFRTVDSVYTSKNNLADALLCLAASKV